MSILITGGAGYIGSQTNFCMLDAGIDTIVFDNMSKGYKFLLPKHSNGHNSSLFIEGDLGDIEALRKVFLEHREIQGVIHFAGSIEVAESVTNPAKYYQNNTVNTLNLLNVMNEFNVKNIVFSSTAATYGLPTSIPISESDMTCPINPYGQSKLAVECILSDYAKAYNMNSICLRYFNACGADTHGRTGECHDPETHLIPIILETVMGKRDSMKIFGSDYNTPDGTCVRDYVHTMDLASAHILAIRKLINFEIKGYTAINLGTAKGFSNLEIVKTVEKVTGIQVNYEIAPRRAGDPDVLVADNTLARKVLGWETRHSTLENIIATAWNWANR
jgi:UDP-glucose 4-epimerase